MRVKSTEFFPNCLKEKNGVQGTPCFFCTNAMEVPLGKLEKKNAIAHFTQRTCTWTQSAEVWIVDGWVGGGRGVHHVLVLGGGRVEGWKDGCSNNQRPGALASLEAG